MKNLFFDGWESLGKILFLSIFSYITLVIILRVSGKRTLSKMNAYDFIVTVALGSVLATIILNKDIALADGALAFGMLVLLQYIFTWLSVRIKFVKKMVTSTPSMLLYKGAIMHEVLKKERITIEELYKAARQQGISDLEKVDVIVLETTGDFSIITNMENKTAGTLKDVRHFTE